MSLSASIKSIQDIMRKDVGVDGDAQPSPARSSLRLAGRENRAALSALRVGLPNSEDRLVQRTFADHLYDVLGWESIYAFNDETFGPTGTSVAPASVKSSLFATSAPPSSASILPCPSPKETDSLAGRIYDFVWQRSAAGALFTADA